MAQKAPFNCVTSTILWTISICFMFCFQVFADFSFSFLRERHSQKKNFRCKQEQPQRGGMSIDTLRTNSL